jgi:exodeoxyribonuclease VIII
MGGETRKNDSDMKAITHLSFSRLGELEHSPLALKKYLEGSKEATAAMNEGSLLDCLLFEPEKLEDRFFIIEKVSRATKEGKALFQDALENANGRTIMNREQYDEQKYICTCIEANATVLHHGLLRRDETDGFKFQVSVDFFYNGFLHRGIKDADGYDRQGNRIIWDLKRMATKSGERDVRSQIRNMGYDLQAAIYCYPFDEKYEHVRYYVIAVDNEGYVTPFEISRDAREKARIRWNKLIKAAHRINMEPHLLDSGCEFWAGSEGFFNF